jgi:hypothetical protein
MFNLEKGGRAGDLYQFLVAYMPRRDLAKLLLFWGGGNIIAIFSEKQCGLTTTYSSKLVVPPCPYAILFYLIHLERTQDAGPVFFGSNSVVRLVEIEKGKTFI